MKDKKLICEFDAEPCINYCLCEISRFSSMKDCVQCADCNLTRENYLKKLNEYGSQK